MFASAGQSSVPEHGLAQAGDGGHVHAGDGGAAEIDGHAVRFLQFDSLDEPRYPLFVQLLSLRADELYVRR